MEMAVPFMSSTVALWTSYLDCSCETQQGTVFVRTPRARCRAIAIGDGNCYHHATGCVYFERILTHLRIA